MKNKQAVLSLILLSEVIIFSIPIEYVQEAILVIANPTSLERNNEMIFIKRSDVENNHPVNIYNH